MHKKYNQLSLSDIYENCNDLFNNDKSKFITLYITHKNPKEVLYEYWPRKSK